MLLQKIRTVNADVFLPLKMAKLKILNISILTISDCSVSAEAYKTFYQVNPTDGISCVLLLLLLRMIPSLLLVNGICTNN